VNWLFRRTDACNWMTLDVCEELRRSQVTVTSLAWLSDAAEQVRCHATRSDQSLRPRRLRRRRRCRRVVWPAVLRAWPDGDRRHTTAPFLRYRWPSRRRAARPVTVAQSSQLISRPVCALLAVVKAPAQLPTVPRHQSHLSYPRPLPCPPSLRYSSFLSSLAWQAFSLSLLTRERLPVAAVTAVPEQPVIGTGANQCVCMCVCRLRTCKWWRLYYFGDVLFAHAWALFANCQRHARTTIDFSASFVDLVVNYVFECRNEKHHLFSAVSESVKEMKVFNDRHDKYSVLINTDIVTYALINHTQTVSIFIWFPVYV